MRIVSRRVAAGVLLPAIVALVLSAVPADGAPEDPPPAAATSVVGSLLEKVRDADRGTSDRAAWDLRAAAAHDPREAASGARRLLEDPDVRLRGIGIDVLGACGEAARPSFAALAKALGDPDLSIRLLACDALVRIGPAAAPTVAAAMKGAPRRVLCSGAAILGSYGPKGKPAAPAVAAALEDPFARPFAVWALGRMGAGAVPELESALSHEDAAVEAAAARALAAMGRDAKAAVFTLSQRVSGPKDGASTASDAIGSTDVGRDACRALAAIGPDAKAAVPNLLEAMRGGSGWAMEALGAIGAPAKSAIPEITKALEDGKRDIWATEALRAFGPLARDAIPALIRCATAGEPTRRSRALRALCAVGAASPKDVLPTLAEGFRSPDEDIRRGAMLSAPLLGGAAVPTLLEIARAEDPEVARDAAIALYWVRADGAPQLIAALGSADPLDRAHAADALTSAEAYPPATVAKAVAALVQALADADARVRKEAAGSLGTFGAAAAPAVPGLVALLGDKAPDVRSQAAWSLGKVGADASESRAALEPLFDDPDAPVRVYAAGAFARLGGDPSRAAAVLAKVLGTDGEKARSAALSELSTLPPVAALCVPQVFAALRGQDADLAESAAEALPALGAAGIDGTALVARRLADKGFHAEEIRALAALGRPGLLALAAGLPPRAGEAPDWQLDRVADLVGPSAAPLLAEWLESASGVDQMRLADEFEDLGPAR